MVCCITVTLQNWMRHEDIILALREQLAERDAQLAQARLQAKEARGGDNADALAVRMPQCFPLQLS